MQKGGPWEIPTCVEAVLRHMEDREVIRDSQYDFTKGKPCLNNMVACSDRVTISVEKKKVTDVIYLDLCKHKF